MTPLQPASLSFSPEGVPFSAQYDDIYHTAAGALAQAQHVFLGGNGLPGRWQGRDSFVIVETGFGLGNNFLATWQAWRADPLRSRQLHFISVEKHPFNAIDLAAAHAASGADPELAAQLQQHWPALLPGCHHLNLDEGRVKLTLLFDDASGLADICARADAIYLDGFAPTKNPQMWSLDVFRALANLADADTTLATWSVSGAVREALAQAGFQTEKRPGFGGKREMLCARHCAPKPRPARPRSREVLVIGAGLAGSAIAERLAARDYDVTLLEAQEDIAQGASGNLAGAFRPLPSQDDNLLSRITRAGFLYGLQHLANLRTAGHEVLWEGCGVLHLARNADQERKQQAVVQALGFPDDFLSWVDAAEATRKAGHTAAFGGWWFARGGWIQPPSLVRANLAQAGARLRLHTGCHVASLQRDEDVWRALDASGREIAQAAQVVLANAHDVRRLAGADWMPLRAARGQVSHLPMAQLAPLGVVVCGQGYITPGIGGHAALGASFVVDDFELALREDEHAENLARLQRMLPDMAPPEGSALQEGRVSLRPVTPDRLPIVGQLPALAENSATGAMARMPGLWTLTGFGARGLVWSSLCAELLAAQMNTEPLPLEASLAAAMDPARFRSGKAAAFQAGGE